MCPRFFQLFKSTIQSLVFGILLLADSGYQGLLALHKNSRISYKKSKKHPLTEEQNGEFVAAMEKVIETSELPYDPEVPVCDNLSTHSLGALDRSITFMEIQKTFFCQQIIQIFTDFLKIPKLSK